MNPQIIDYNNSIQNPDLNLGDAELQHAKVVFAAGRMTPLQGTGRFAAIYRLQMNDRNFAIKCFTLPKQDLQTRYMAISDELRGLPAASGGSYFVGFDYQSRGMCVRDKWYPIVKMDWVSGDRLDEYIQKHVGDSNKLSELAAKWLDLSASLRRLGIAHGDLQPENVFVVDGELKLVDYDDMFVPSLAAQVTHAMGVPNFQHPDRDASHFGPYLDNFSDWVMYTSLVALSVDPTLLQPAALQDQYLIFRRQDFQQPDSSSVFEKLLHEKSSSPEVRRLATSLRNALRYSVEYVPPLNRWKDIPQPILQPNKTNRPLAIEWHVSQQLNAAGPDCKSATLVETFGKQISNRIGLAEKLVKLAAAKSLPSTAKTAEQDEPAPDHAPEQFLQQAKLDGTAGSELKRTPSRVRAMQIVGLSAAGCAAIAALGLTAIALLNWQPVRTEIQSLTISARNRVRPAAYKWLPRDLYCPLFRDTPAAENELKLAIKDGSDKQYGKAVAEYSTAIMFDPTMAKTYSRRGYTYHKMGTEQAALADLDQGVALDAKTSFGYQERGTYYYDLHSYSLALADYNRSIELAPSSALGYYSRGSVLMDQKDYSSAIADFTQATQLDGTDADSFYRRGICYEWIDNLVYASADLTNASRLYGNNGNTHMQQESADQAQRVINKQLERLRKQNQTTNLASPSAPKIFDIQSSKN